MATMKLASCHLINAHLEPPLASSTPFTERPYSKRLHPVLCSKGISDLQSHRQKIVKEIFDTEHSYISQLNTIVSMFLKPIRVGCLLPCDAINTIFSNVEGILSVNVELFTCMRQKSLGEAFSYLAPFLKLYSTYAKNFQSANETLQDWMKRSTDLTHFVTSQESRPECCGLSLPALLITPVQRIPRYRLLLEDLLKHTKCTHPDYSKLNAASAQIAAVASHINEHIRQHENFKKMLAIQNSLTGQCVPGILSPGRRFLQEGRLMKVCRRKPKERMVFLFSDILIYARPNLLEKMESARTYECRCVLPLLNSAVRVVLGDSKVPGVGVLFKVSNADTSLLFFSHKQEEVFQWAQAIEDVIRNLQLAFGSLLNTNKAPVHTGDTVENPLLKLGNLDKPPASPYPMTATLVSSRSLEDLSSKSKKRDSGFSEQQGTVTMSEVGGNSDIRTNTADSHTYSQQSDGTQHHHDGQARPKGSNPLLSRPLSTCSDASLQRPHSAGEAVMRVGTGATKDLSHQRRKRRRNLKARGCHHRAGYEGVVLMNEHVVEVTEEEEEEVEVPDESAGAGLSAATNGAMPQPNGQQTSAQSSAYSNTVRSSCCTIL